MLSHKTIQVFHLNLGEETTEERQARRESLKEIIGANHFGFFSWDIVDWWLRQSDRDDLICSLYAVEKEESNIDIITIETPDFPENLLVDITSPDFFVSKGHKVLRAIYDKKGKFVTYEDLTKNSLLCL